ncbi:MarR family winged helix-turn-helix transcriptional regulator [Azoarcus sp. KH32C]|uniref:MarR family winged helix-turn-helix transcriptional regulator n=1 Tax=Azoarcus sp. KH32C TaxID=748247 RepID=UPI000238651D|nr:MarR family transcriptional regulator [Azoarcus sp. KH32C]BAL25220.1 transcriptional regulator, MarR family [Azoarcus sp. KH32C]
MRFSEDTFGFLLSDTARLLRRAFEQSVQNTPITLAQARALVYLARNEGIRQVDLADLLEIQPMTLARLIDQLAAENLVERRQDPTDRRAYRLYLTEKAGAHLDAIAEVAEGLRNRALDGISDEDREQVMAVLRRVRQNLAAR